MKKEKYRMVLEYKKELYRTLRIKYPTDDPEFLKNYVDSKVKEMIKDEKLRFYNNYTNEDKTSSVLGITEFYYSDIKPVTTEHGCLFKQSPDNPASSFLRETKKERDVLKYKRKKSDKGSLQYKKYDLFQSLKKVIMNAFYGICGNKYSQFFNLHTATAITGKGQAIIAIATQAFEMFLCNNSLFKSLDECIVFVKNVINDGYKMNDSKFVKDVTIEKVMYKLERTFENKNDFDYGFIYSLIRNCNQRELNRLYYKNNLFAFCHNEPIKEMINGIISNVDNFTDNNNPPEHIVDRLEELWRAIEEFVFYNHQIMDRIYRLKHSKRKAVVVIDTDSQLGAVCGDIYRKLC